MRLGAQDFVRAAAREKSRKVRYSTRGHTAAHAELVHATTLLTVHLAHVARLAGEPHRVYRVRKVAREPRARTRIEFSCLALARRRRVWQLILWRGRESHPLPRATPESRAVTEHFPCAREAI